MSSRRTLTITDTDGDDLTVDESDPEAGHALEITTTDGHTVYLARRDLDDLRSFLLSVAART